MTRLVVETGGIMTGGAAHVGMLRVAMATRSVTSCRAASSSAPRARIAETEESWGTELDRRISTPGTPFIAFSIGTVTCSSTSAGESPRQSVWTSTPGRRELRKDIDRNVLQPLGTEICQAEAERHDDEAKTQACSDDPPDHDLKCPSNCYSPFTPTSVPYSSGTPTVTTFVPAGGPSSR